MRTQRLAWWAGSAVIAVVLGLGASGCPGDTELAESDANQGGGTSSSGSGAGDGAAGSSGNGGRSGSSGGVSGSGSGDAGSGTAGSGAGGAGSGAAGAGSGAAGSGAGGGDVCPPGIPIPAICRTCADGTCGEAVCVGGGRTVSFRCPEDGEGGSGGGGEAGTGGGDSGGCVHGGCSSQLCVEASDPPIASTCEWRAEYACYQAAQCARQADGECGFTESPELTECLAGGGGAGNLQWYATCGDSVCSSQPDPDDPSVPNCTNAMEVGNACDAEGATCETGACGGHIVCAATDPVGNFGCPISRARYKQAIDYADDAQLSRWHDELTHMPLATWEYKHAPGVPQLGFIIEDIEPSAAVGGDRVNLYGYLSMAVAAIQVQQRQIEALQGELSALRDGHLAAPDALACSP